MKKDNSPRARYDEKPELVDQKIQRSSHMWGVRTELLKKSIILVQNMNLLLELNY